MTHATQQIFRFTFPGLAVAVGVSGLLSGRSPTDFFSSFELSTKSIGAPLLLVLAVGALYWATGVAKKFRRWTFKRSGGRITQRLCQYAEQRGIQILNPTLPQFQRCIQEQWYRIIDSDKQLTTKSEAIRLNGTVATSALEVVIVALLMAIVFCVIGSPRAKYQWIGLCLCVSLAALITFIGTRRGHVHLVDEQIDIAERNLGGEITKSVAACSEAGREAI